jgi:hypothetical protein
VSSAEAQILLRKEAAAQRQIDAAIRMILHGEDELAVHSVAAAAYGILRGLKKKHGRGEVRDRFGLAIFLYASDLESGKIDALPESITVSKWLADTIMLITAEIKAGRVKTAEDVIKKLAIKGEASYWAEFNQSANFLKHADRDPSGVLDPDKLTTETEMMLGSAISAYIEIMGGGSSTWEMFVYAAFCGLDMERYPPKLRKIATQPLPKRRLACLSVLGDLKKRGYAALL